MVMSGLATVGATLASRSRLPLEMLWKSSAVCAPLNGRSPLSSSNSVTPKAQMSVAGDAGFPLRSSGATYGGLPTNIPSCVRSVTVVSLAIPKSMSFTSPSRVIMMLEGLRSRCSS
jgi:hypothetical protein